MHHHGAMRLVVFADVLKFEAFRQVEVPLHRAELPESPDGVFDFEVNLRPVESGLAFDALVSDAALVQSIGERALGLRPILFRAEIILVRLVAFNRQLELYLLEAERAENFDDEIHAIADLLAHLFGRAEEGGGGHRDWT